MTVKYFVDTNVVLYTIGQDKRKVEIARKIISAKPIISAQVVNESVNVCLRKFNFNKEQAYVFADNVMRRTTVAQLMKRLFVRVPTLPFNINYPIGTPLS